MPNGQPNGVKKNERINEQRDRQTYIIRQTDQDRKSIGSYLKEEAFGESLYALNVMRSAQIVFDLLRIRNQVQHVTPKHDQLRR